RLRRTMLKWHQGLGFTTLAVLAATLVIGQLDYLDKFDTGGNFTQKYTEAHWALAGAATALFATTGMLALFAPNPYPKPLKFDAAFVHKAAMAAATACFVAQIILGPISVAKQGTVLERPLALSHLVIGYASWGF